MRSWSKEMKQISVSRGEEVLCSRDTRLFTIGKPNWISHSVGNQHGYQQKNLIHIGCGKGVSYETFETPRSSGNVLYWGICSTSLLPSPSPPGVNQVWGSWRFCVDGWPEGPFWWWYGDGSDGGVISLFEVCGLEEGAEEEEDEHGDDGVEEDVDANTDDEDEGEDSTIVVTSHDTKWYHKTPFSQRQVHPKQTLAIICVFFCAPGPALETSTSPGRLEEERHFKHTNGSARRCSVPSCSTVLITL